MTIVVGLAVLAIATSRSMAGGARDLKTVESATEVIRNLSNIPLRCIPPALMQDAKAVAIIPNVVKAGLVFDHRSGHGLVMIRQPNGTWSEPIFVEIEGNGIGLEAGIESTDLVLVFRTVASLDHMLKGKLTLGTDAAVAAGPVGRDVETDHERWGKVDVFSYSRSRGLFAGLSLTGSRLFIDHKANEAFYGIRGCRPEDISTGRFTAVPAVETLKLELMRISAPPMVKIPRYRAP
jgi:lipid-binding SYLF domain-containing protein